VERGGEMRMLYKSGKRGWGMKMLFKSERRGRGDENEKELEERVKR
jgi:hypothetical protein